MIKASHFILISVALFFGGLLGCWVKQRNLIIMLVCLELILISVQLNLIINSFNLDDPLGQIFVLLILIVAAAEVSLGLTFLIVYYRLRGTVESKHIYLTKG